MNAETACERRKVRKRGGVQKSMGNEVLWNSMTGMTIYLPVTSRPLIPLQKQFHHLVTSRPPI